MSSLRVDSVNQRGIMGEIIPGITVFKKLEKKGLIFFTEEEPIVINEMTGEVFDLAPLIYLVENTDSI